VILNLSIKLLGSQVARILTRPEKR
jgi:hypothetical protein